MARHARIVLVSGCFDPFHVGHLAMLHDARVYGDQLVVSVTNDEWVRKQKGPSRPVFPIVERVAMVAALRIVDDVQISNAADAVEVIRKVKPAVYVKGLDYRDGDPSGRLDLERAAVEAVGGQLIFIDAWPRYSSTAILKALA